MKRESFLLSILAVCALNACQKEETPPLAAEPLKAGIKLEVNVTGIKTRLADVGDENAVSNLKVFVYKEDGSLEASTEVSESSATLSVTSGKKTVAAILNASGITSVTTLEALRNSLSPLSDNKAGGLVMYGEQTADINSDTGVSVEVSRLVAKIMIDKITNALSLAQYSQTEIDIKAIYLINVAGNCPYASSVKPTLWLNKKAFNSSECKDILYEQVSGVSIAHGKSSEATHSFYCYPNATLSDSSVPEWCERYTRLIVETAIDGQTKYYPISIPGIAANSIYEITELTITRPGSDSPDEPICVEDAKLSISIMPWAKGTNTNVTI